MKTKLETIAGFLAGREDGAAPLRGELGDPSSEASLFLEATRSRSRALIAEPAGVPGGPGAEPEAARRPPRSWAMGLFGVMACLLAVAALLWVGEVRLHRLESRLERDRLAVEADLRASEGRLARALEALKPGPPRELPPSREPAIEAAVNRLQTALDGHGRRLDELARAGPAPAVPFAPRPDPSLAEIRAELVLIRREAAANELASGRQMQELRTIVQELNEVIRRLLNRPPGGPGRGPPAMIMPGTN